MVKITKLENKTALLWGIVILVIVTLVSSKPDFLRKPENIEFLEYYTCAGPDPETGGLTSHIDQFDTNTQIIYLCRYLKTSDPARITVAWRKNDKDLAVSYSRNIYEEGYFFAKLEASVIGKNLEIGDYTVVADNLHETLAMAEFSVSSSE